MDPNGTKKAYKMFRDLIGKGNYQTAYEVFSENKNIIYLMAVKDVRRYHDRINEKIGPREAFEFKSKLKEIVREMR